MSRSLFRSYSDFPTLLSSWRSLPSPVRALLTSYEDSKGYDDDVKDVKGETVPELDESSE